MHNCRTARTVFVGVFPIGMKGRDTSVIHRRLKQRSLAGHAFHRFPQFPRMHFVPRSVPQVGQRKRVVTLDVVVVA